MAPEQARGDEIDARCDVYAAGILLYELLTGSVPFVGHSPLSVLTAHMTATPQPPRERASDRGISPALEAVALHAIAKDPAKRYGTARALASAIRAALASPLDLEAVRPLRGQGAPADTTGARPASVVPFAVPPPAPVGVERDRSVRTWLVVCIIAGIVGIAVGVWLSTWWGG